jgi:hypothetical protein
LSEEQKEELEADTYLDDQLSQPKQRSHSEELNTSTSSFKIGDLVTNGTKNGRIVRLHPEPNWVYVNFNGNPSPFNDVPYHCNDLKHQERYLLNFSPSTEEVAKLFTSPPANLEIGAEVRFVTRDAALQSYVGRRCWIEKINSKATMFDLRVEFDDFEKQLGGIHYTDLVGVIPTIPISDRTEWIIDCVRDYRIGLVLAEYDFMEPYWVSKRELLPLERANPILTVNVYSQKDEKLPLEQIEQNLHERLAQLECKRDAILAIGPVAQSGIWIEYGKISKRKFRQAYYRSNTPIFEPKRQGTYGSSESGLVKRQYIGEENSKEVKKAGEAIARRNELERITKEIKLIEEKL